MTHDDYDDDDNSTTQMKMMFSEPHAHTDEDAALGTILSATSAAFYTFCQNIYYSH